MSVWPPQSMLPRRASTWVVLALAPVPVALLAGGLFLTEPLQSGASAPPVARAAERATTWVPAGRTGSTGEERSPVSLTPPAIEERDPAEPTGPPRWPEGRLEGEPAKRLLLAVLLHAQQRLDVVSGYTATFRKQERIGGTLGPLQTLEMKVRHEPFSVYLRFLAPKAGKEAVYCEGRYDNHVIAHRGDWSRLLVPRLKVAPTDPIALADSRHPITDAGLKNLTDRLVGYRRLDLEDPDAVTILDTINDEEGATWLRSLHTHPHQVPERPFARVEILYDPDTLLPRSITSYDWPGPGQTSTLELAERYIYDDLVLNAPLQDSDFDPSNPEYAFTRF